MKAVAVIADKGGVGKSTLSIHLAVEASRRNLTSVILGCDPQACSELWADLRNKGKEEKLPPAVLTTQAARVPHVVENAKANNVHFLVVDIGANSDNGATYAVRAADLVLIPTSPRIFDINGVEEMARRAREYKKPYFVVLNRLMRGPYRAEAEAYLSAWNHPTCPLALYERVAFANCLSSGVTAMESEPESTAAKEFIAFYDWVEAQLLLRQESANVTEVAVG
jgi:chromosome partitioning protein